MTKSARDIFYSYPYLPHNGPMPMYVEVGEYEAMVSNFYSLRHAIFMNFITRNAPIKEEDLTPEICRKLIKDIGEDYIRRNKRGITKLGTLGNQD